MSQYVDGTVSVTAGDATVTGTGTLFVANVAAGDMFFIAGSLASYVVGSITDNTHLELTTNYGGATAAGQSYRIQSSRTPVLGLPYPEIGDLDQFVIVTEAIRLIEDYLVAATAAGRHQISILAKDMRPSAAGGCAALATIVSAANQPDISTLDFDTTTQEYAQFCVPMPKRWNEGTVTFKPIWSHAATTVNFGVVWDLQAIALSDDDAIAQAFGTAQTSTDTGGTTNDLYVGPESAAITVAGTPAAEDVVMFRISRVTGNAGDTLGIDARLHGIKLYITTDAENDA